MATLFAEAAAYSLASSRGLTIDDLTASEYKNSNKKWKAKLLRAAAHGGKYEDVHMHSVQFARLTCLIEKAMHEDGRVAELGFLIIDAWYAAHAGHERVPGRAATPAAAAITPPPPTPALHQEEAPPPPPPPLSPPLPTDPPLPPPATTIAVPPPPPATTSAVPPPPPPTDTLAVPQATDSRVDAAADAPCPWTGPSICIATAHKQSMSVAAAHTRLQRLPAHPVVGSDVP